MTNVKAKTVTEAYSELIAQLTAQTEIIGNTKELTNCQIEISNPSLTNICFHERAISQKYANAELHWYWSADNSCYTIGKSAKKWLSISDDGLTSNSAYGYIIFKKYDKNQLEEVIKLLQTDANTRRAVLNISDPTIDRISTKDMQCTIALQFLLRHNKLHMTVYMRSNDIIYGFPYDYIFFETLHQYVAYRLNVEIGTYTHNATSLHIYLSDLDKLTFNDTKFSIDFMSIIAEDYAYEK